MHMLIGSFEGRLWLLFFEKLGELIKGKADRFLAYLVDAASTYPALWERHLGPSGADLGPTWRQLVFSSLRNAFFRRPTWDKIDAS